MKKEEIIEEMAKDAGISKAAAGVALQSLQNGIMEAVKKSDGRISLSGFGTFSKSHRKARTGRNPQTGETITIKASSTVKFSPHKKLKEALL